MDDALYKQLEQERLLNQVTTQIRQSLDVSVILSTAVKQLRQLLWVDRLLIYQFNEISADWIGEQTNLGLLSESEPFDSNAHQEGFERERTTLGCVTYEARSSERIVSVLSTVEASDCFMNITQLKEKYRQGFTQAISDIETAYQDSPCFITVLRRLQVKSKLVIPIIVQDDLWGFLIAHQCFQTRQWQSGEIRFLVKVTEHLSIAIYQAQLYAQVQQQKQTLEQRVIDRTEALNDALLAAQSANRAKSEFLATMSHELRTPLTCVIGISATLIRYYSGKLGLKQMPLEKQRDYLKTIHDSGAQLLELINDILDLSQVESGKTVLNLGEFSLTKLTHKVLQGFQEKANKKGVKLTSKIKVSPQEDQFIADQHRVQQVLSNLLENAIKFTSREGQVILRVSVKENTAILQIQDTGIGISEDQQPLLFEKFQQLNSSLNRQYGGTGLGLALTKQLVELHGGVIKLDSKLGVGSTFTVHIPCQRLITKTAQGQVTSVPFKTALPSIHFDSSPGRFVLIEPCEEIATIICDLLTAAGYQVIWLVERYTAVQQINLLQPHAVIIDLQLPGQYGYELIQQLRQNPQLSALKIFALINQENGDTEERILTVGADGWITKPIKPNQLLHTIMALEIRDLIDGDESS